MGHKKVQEDHLTFDPKTKRCFHKLGLKPFQDPPPDWFFSCRLSFCRLSQTHTISCSKAQSGFQLSPVLACLLAPRATRCTASQWHGRPLISNVEPLTGPRKTHTHTQRCVVWEREIVIGAMHVIKWMCACSHGHVGAEQKGHCQLQWILLPSDAAMRELHCVKSGFVWKSSVVWMFWLEASIWQIIDNFAA